MNKYIFIIKMIFIPFLFINCNSKEKGYKEGFEYVEDSVRIENAYLEDVINAKPIEDIIDIRHSYSIDSSIGDWIFLVRNLKIKDISPLYQDEYVVVDFYPYDIKGRHFIFSVRVDKESQVYPYILNQSYGDDISLLIHRTPLVKGMGSIDTEEDGYLITANAFFILGHEKLEFREREENCDDCLEITNYREFSDCIRKSKSFSSATFFTHESQWIEKAEFLTCDDKRGYFIINLRNGNEYIHKGLPIEMWNEFKSAPSYGSYYSSRIKGKYNF